jgi:hypothetical protein
VIEVYWGGNEHIDAYKQPESLFTEVANISPKKSDFIRCRGWQSLGKNTFSVATPASSHYKIEKNELKMSEGSMDAVLTHPNEFGYVVRPNFPWFLFSEKPLVATWTPPYMHPLRHMRYGYSLPGRFNISKWLRPFWFEFVLWNNEIIFEKNEPFGYFTFDTDEKIVWKRFIVDESILEVSNVCSNISGGSLKEYYKRFNDANFNEITLERIRKNLI